VLADSTLARSESDQSLGWLQLLQMIRC
jgi:hypothetical protein